jgi:hypothetical protein
LLVVEWKVSVELLPEGLPAARVGGLNMHDVPVGSGEPHAKVTVAGRGAPIGLLFTSSLMFAGVPAVI